jgi:hypothetical protein
MLCNQNHFLSWVRRESGLLSTVAGLSEKGTGAGRHFHDKNDEDKFTFLFYQIMVLAS